MRLATLALAAGAALSGGCMSSSPRLTWKPTTLAPGLDASVPEGGTYSATGTPEHGWMVSGKPPVLVGVWWGTGEDLARWRGGFQPEESPAFGKERTTSVCGRPARRLEVTTSGRAPDHVAVPGGAALEEHPAETAIAVELEHGGAPVLAYYVIATAERRRYAADEAHFFASIRCR
jgi:hypothetical protein